MKPRFDVVALGGVAVDDLLYATHYPAADEKAEVLRRERQCGGISAIAAITVARLGGSAAYAGVLGCDELSDFAVRQLRQEGVNLRHLCRREGVRPVHSVIIVDSRRATRNIFFDTSGFPGVGADWPTEEVIQSARVFFADWFSVPGMIRAARVAREAGIPIVADFERNDLPGFSKLLALPDHLILSETFAATLTGTGNPVRALKKMRKKNHVVTAVTAGARGCWYISAENPHQVRFQPAFKVKTVDTTGCGDVFHGAYAAALARGFPVAERMRFAAATAALKASRPGAQRGIPTLADVEKFLHLSI